MDDPRFAPATVTDQYVAGNKLFSTPPSLCSQSPPSMVGWASAAFPTTSADDSCMSSKRFSTQPRYHNLYVFHGTVSNSWASVWGEEEMFVQNLFYEWYHWGVVEWKSLLWFNNTHQGITHNLYPSLTMVTFTASRDCLFPHWFGLFLSTQIKIETSHFNMHAN